MEIKANPKWFVVPYEENHFSVWDELIFRSADGCLLQSRAFLGYHGERFRDKSVLIYSSNNELVGVLPCAEISSKRLASHPGSTFGGLVTREPLGVENSLQIIDSIGFHYRSLGYQEMIYTAMPTSLHRLPNESDLYSLWLKGATMLRRQPTFIIDPKVDQLGRRKNRKIAEKHNLKTSVTLDTPAVFSLIETELVARHGVPPVHTLHEIQDLETRLGSKMFTVGTSLDGELLAGAIVFDLGKALHTQYLGNTSEGRKVQALDSTVEFIYKLSDSQEKVLSFGISSDQSGLNVNWGLAQFKENFGASLRTIDRYEWIF